LNGEQEQLILFRLSLMRQLFAVWITLLFAGTLAAASLDITYSPAGLQQLSYNGVTLEDMAANRSDAFHIGHMKATDQKGNVLTGGQYDWGENNNGHTWDAAAKTWTYLFTWGSIKIKFVQSGDTLDLQVTQANSANSGVVFQGAAIYPFVLHFPQLPAGFVDAKYQQLAFNTTAPSVTAADYGRGQVVAVVPDAAKPLYSGFEPAGPVNAYFPVISGTAIDNLATFFPRNDRPVKPGETDTFTVSLRFAPSGMPASNLAADVYRNWAKVWPPVLHWPDRRIIGTAFLANSPQGNINQPGGYPNNPRRYFNISNPADFDIATPGGLAKFQARVLSRAKETVQNLKRLKAQGVITWDIEGEQYPQPTSYVCAPDEIATVAPEMESVIADGASRYHGMKLDDAYFKTIRDAGFRVGVCVRPQHYTLKGETANQDVLPDSQIAAELTRKMEFAHQRWGVTLFYVDSSVEENGRILDAGIFQKVAAAFPDSLVIPEQTTRKYFAYTAPFASFIFHGDLGTPADVHSYYPNAFSANLVNDVSPAKLAKAAPQLIKSVKQGDILMVLADHWEPNNTAVVKMYEVAAAGGKGNP
jgi:hypothetical protein